MNPQTKKFEYPDINAFGTEIGRVYEIGPNLFFPSITTVLGATISEEKKASLQRWIDGIGKEKANQILVEAGLIGTQVHLMAERYLCGIPPWNDSDAFESLSIKRFNAIRIKLKNVTTVLGQEVALFSRELMVAGRTDLVGEWNGIPAIIDYKTSRRLKNESDINDYKLQLMFYAKAHNDMFNTNIKLGIIIMASDDAIPQLFKVDLNDTLLNNLKERINQWYLKLENGSI